MRVGDVGAPGRPACIAASWPWASTFHHRSIVDTLFEAAVVGDGPPIGGRGSVITEVEGSAYRTGEALFSLDERDPLGTGFLLR